MDGASTKQTRTEWLRAALAEHEAPLLRYATRLLRGDIERARDVVQETFLRLWKAEPADVADHLTEWLFTVCRNRAIDVARKEGPMIAQGEEPRPLEGPAALEAPPTPLAVAERREEARGVLAALERLPERQQEIVRLKFQAGLSYREIGAVTGDSPTNVGFLLHQALKTIRADIASAPRPVAARRTS